MKVGIVGAGGMGNVHALKYSLMPDVEIHVFDISKHKLEAFARRHEIKAHSKLESLLSTIDALDVCTPTDTHAGIAIPALERGISTLVEKPIAGSMEDCHGMINAAKKGGATLMPAQVVRFFPEHRKAHELIASGSIGRVASVRLRRGGRAPQGQDGWFLDPGRSGGVLLDLAVHEFDWLCWTLGPVMEVMSRSVTLGPRIEGADFVGDYALTTLTHASGCISHVESTWMDPSGFRTTIEAAGSEGVIEFDSRQNPSLRVHLQDSGSRPENLMDPLDDPYYLQLRSFVDAVTGKAGYPVSADEGAAAVRIALAAIESARSCQPVKIG